MASLTRATIGYWRFTESGFRCLEKKQDSDRRALVNQPIEWPGGVPLFSHENITISHSLAFTRMLWPLSRQGFDSDS
jgi:hypothetical protein